MWLKTKITGVYLASWHRCTNTKTNICRFCALTRPRCHKTFPTTLPKYFPHQTKSYICYKSVSSLNVLLHYLVKHMSSFSLPEANIYIIYHIIIYRYAKQTDLADARRDRCCCPSSITAPVFMWLSFLSSSPDIKQLSNCSWVAQ